MAATPVDNARWLSGHGNKPSIPGPGRQRRRLRPGGDYAPRVASEEDVDERRQALANALEAARSEQGSEISQRLGRRLAAVRQAHGVFTQRAAATALGMHKNHVWRVEGGQANPSYEALAAMAFLYEMPLEELLKGCGFTIE